MSTITILGLGDTKRGLDMQERREMGQVWGLPWDSDAFWCDRLFEMHDRSLWDREFQLDRRKDYVAQLRSFDVPIYMQDWNEDIPSSCAYPLDIVREDVFARFPKGPDYLGSSPAYMLALAIHEKPERIAIYGVDLHAKDGYLHQRPNLEWMVGLAMGRGIDIEVPKGSALLEYRPTNEFGLQAVCYPERYGWL